MPPPEPSISVVVATYNRAAILARTLEHLTRQTVAPEALEVIVVDDGSTDETARIVRETAECSAVRIAYLTHGNRGPGHTQNRGIRAARGALVLLIADDIFLTPGAVAAHLAWHAQHSDACVAVLGKAAPSEELAGAGVLSGGDAFGLGRFEHLRELPYLLFWGFNVSFKRDFMLAHGMFRDARGRGGSAAHEDTELGYRLHRAGMKLLYAADALGHHYHPTSLRQSTRRYHERGLNYPDLVARVPDPMLPVVFHVPTWGAWGEYARAVRACPWLVGRERSVAWHAFRHVARGILFNRVTVPLLWSRLLATCESNGGRAAAMAGPLFGPMLFYHFLSGIRDARFLPPPPGGNASA